MQSSKNSQKFKTLKNEGDIKLPDIEKKSWKKPTCTVVFLSETNGLSKDAQRTYEGTAPGPWWSTITVSVS